MAIVPKPLTLNRVSPSALPFRDEHGGLDWGSKDYLNPKSM